MENIELKDIVFDKTDALLFSYDDDLLIKAKAIQNSILPKLHALLVKATNKIESIYKFSVYDNNSHEQFWPHFREIRENDLKVNYENAGFGISASRLKIWKRLSRDDKKEVTIIPVHLYYRFYDEGLMCQFAIDDRINQLSIESFRFLFTKLYEIIEEIQTIAIAYGFEIWVGYKDEQLIPIKKRLQKIIKSEDKSDYSFYITKFYKLPFNADKSPEVVDDFASLFPIYYELILASEGKESQFKNLLGKFKNYYLTKLEEQTDVYDNKARRKVDVERIKAMTKKTVDAIGVKPGLRWQVFERDNFKCVACGLSAKDGAILHVDHIIPRSKGGSDAMDNYQTLCQKCNIGKSNKSKRNLRKQ